MASYSFLTPWLIEAPRERVFEALWESQRWPEWWPGVTEATELAPGDPVTGVGRRGRYEWRSRIPYPVRFEVVATRIERPWLLEGIASGDLEGTGTWRLFEEHGLTLATYDWQVRTTKRWMNALAPVARPLFRRNHDHVMRAGGDALAGYLAADLSR